MDTLLEATGLEVLDLRSDPSFAARQLHVRDIATQLEGLQRLSGALIEDPETILQELVNAAVQLCGADSAGISIEREGGTDDEFYQWIATAGDYSGFLDAILPRSPSACGLCLERGGPQHFTVARKFFEILGVEAPLVTDGILLPWEADGSRGTIFVMAHGRTEAFDANDARLMRMLADFAAMGFRQLRQHRRHIEQTRLSSAASMAHELAHQINNPLQSITNIAYLLAEGGSDLDTCALGLELSGDVARLAELVRGLLAIPIQANRPAPR